MIGRVLVVASVLVLAGGVLLIRQSPHEAPVPSPEPRIPATAELKLPEPAPDVVGDSEPSGASPDRRALAALAWVHHLWTGEPSSVVQASPRDGVWQLQHQGRQIGTLPAAPDYAALSAFLDTYARKLGAGPLGEDAKLDLAQPLERVRRFHHVAVLEGLEDLGARWQRGERDPRVLDLALRGSAYLSLQLVDRLELADELHARAWALLTLARAANTGSVALAEAILAHRMGYTRASRLAAQRLDAIDPLRQWLEDDPALFGPKGELERGAFGTFLRVLRVAEKRNRKVWVDFLKQNQIDPKAATYLFVMSGAPRGDTELRRQYGPMAMTHAAASAAWLVDPNAAASGDEAAPTLARFESQLRALGETRGRSFARGAAWHFYRAMYFSGVEQRSELLLGANGSAAAMEAFLGQLGVASSDFAREYMEILETRTRRMKASDG